MTLNFQREEFRITTCHFERILRQCPSRPRWPSMTLCSSPRRSALRPRKITSRDGTKESVSDARWNSWGFQKDYPLLRLSWWLHHSLTIMIFRISALHVDITAWARNRHSLLNLIWIFQLGQECLSPAATREAASGKIPLTQDFETYLSHKSFFICICNMSPWVASSKVQANKEWEGFQEGLVSRKELVAVRQGRPLLIIVLSSSFVCHWQCLDGWPED